MTEFSSFEQGLVEELKENLSDELARTTVEGLRSQQIKCLAQLACIGQHSLATILEKVPDNNKGVIETNILYLKRKASIEIDRRVEQSRLVDRETSANKNEKTLSDAIEKYKEVVDIEIPAPYLPSVTAIKKLQADIWGYVDFKRDFKDKCTNSAVELRKDARSGEVVTVEKTEDTNESDSADMGQALWMLCLNKLKVAYVMTTGSKATLESVDNYQARLIDMACHHGYRKTIEFDFRFRSAVLPGLRTTGRSFEEVLMDPRYAIELKTDVITNKTYLPSKDQRAKQAGSRPTTKTTFGWKNTDTWASGGWRRDAEGKTPGDKKRKFVFCKDHQRGACAYGDLCNFAHSQSEIAIARGA
jgi:hypothetical protein